MLPGVLHQDREIGHGIELSAALTGQGNYQGACFLGNTGSRQDVRRVAARADDNYQVIGVHQRG